MRKLTLGKIYKNGIQYSGTTDAATNINYDNSKGAIRAGNVQGAIDEIMETTSQSRTLTQAEYDALPDTKYTDGIEYFITDAEPLDASTIAYDNTTSKMTATNVQAGIDELNSNLTQVQSQIVPTASIESGAFASKAYSKGDFLVKNGSLWKATTDISKDDALTPANIVPTTVGSELSSIKSNLSNKSFEVIATATANGNVTTTKPLSKFSGFMLSIHDGPLNRVTPSPFAVRELFEIEGVQLFSVDDNANASAKLKRVDDNTVSFMQLKNVKKAYLIGFY